MPLPPRVLQVSAGARGCNAERQEAEAGGDAPTADQRCPPNPCLLDFGCLRDVSQLLVQAEDFGILLLDDSDEIVQKSDVPRTEEQRG